MPNRNPIVVVQEVGDGNPIEKSPSNVCSSSYTKAGKISTIPAKMTLVIKCSLLSVLGQPMHFVYVYCEIYVVQGIMTQPLPRVTVTQCMHRHTIYIVKFPLF